MSAIVKFEEIKGDLSVLLKSGDLPKHIKTEEQVYLIQKMGAELGFSLMQSIHFIIPIQGRLTLATKALGALLRKGGVKFTTLEDAVWIYNDGTTKPVHFGDQKPIDRRTTIRFERGDQIEETFFLWSDATTQGLIGKDNWKRMPREMLYARCLTKGANRIGQDLTMGLYSTDEMVDAIGDEKKVIRGEEGFVESVIDDVPYENVK